MCLSKRINIAFRDNTSYNEYLVVGTILYLLARSAKPTHAASFKALLNRTSAEFVGLLVRFRTRAKQV